MSTASLEKSISSATKTSLWYTRCPVPTAFGLALQLGWIDAEFAEDEDIEIRALQTSADPKVHQSHFSHTQKNSFRQGGNLPAIWAQSSGANTRVIGLSWIQGPYTVLSLPDSGIKTAADLKGKRLLAVRRPKEGIDFAYAMSLRTYETALTSVGLTLGDAHIVEHAIARSYLSDRIQPGNRDYVNFRESRKGGSTETALLLLLRGEVDAIPSASVGSLRLVELLGLHVVFDEASLRSDAASNNGKPETFAVSAELIEERPDLVARVLARALQAVEWAANNPSDAIRFIAREQGASEQHVEEAYGSALQASLEINLVPRSIEGLRNVKDFLLGKGLIPRNFDVNQWIDPRPLKAARALLEERRKTAKYQAEVASRAGVQPSGVRASSCCSIR